jgi:glycosyltransferase involved in cell wall biosynthesis
LEKANKLKVLFWPGWWYPSRINPLSGVFIQRHAQAVSSFCRIAVLYIVPDPGLAKKHVVETTVEKGLRVTRIFFRPGPGIPWLAKLADIVRYYRLSRLGLKAVREDSGTPDILHVQVNPPLGQIAYILAHAGRTPCIFSEHWSGYFPESGAYRGFIRKCFTRLLVRKARAVTVVSLAAQKAMQRHGLENDYHVIPNVVDLGLFTPAPGKNRDGKKIVLHVSGFNPCKNIPGILRAVKMLAEKRNDFELHLVGDGAGRGDLEELAASLQIKDRVVRFHGRKSEEEVSGFMRRADLFLMFSDYENSPCVIAEAFASGLPVIATRTGGIPEHVHDDNGILVAPGDVAGLARALAFMLDHPGNYDSGKIREYALRNFSPDAIGRRFYDLYRSVADAAAEGQDAK